MSDNTSMACGYSCNNIHQHEDGMVLLQFSPNLVPQLGCPRVGWIAPMSIDCISGLSYLSHAPIKYMECLATHPWHVVLHAMAYTNLRMAWLFCSSYQIWPTAYGYFAGLDGQHTCVLIVFQACLTSSMHPQNIWNA